MDTPDLDLLLHRLHTDRTAAPSSLCGNIISRLGPSAQSVQSAYIAGICACCAAVIISVAISLEVARDAEVVTAPPALSLFSDGAIPFASL
jgi:hypothetical protein